MTTISSLELRSKITSEARLELWLEKVTVPKPAADEVVVRIDAAPLNPSDIILLSWTRGPGQYPSRRHTDASDGLCKNPARTYAGA
jgi:NADPH:quinone reductase-like Zn-dependent oxidoreductase